VIILIEYKCEYCGNVFMGYKCHKRKYCSHTCSRKAIHQRNPNLRFARRTKREFKLNDEIKDYIDGLLLGDACIKKRTPRLTQSFARRYLEWAKIIEKDLSDFGISSKLTFYHVDDVRTNKMYEGISLQSLGYIQFKKIREEWYSNGKKIVPKDLVLKPIIIRNWYLGDGSYSGNHLKFSTQGFDEMSVIELKERFKEIGYNCYISCNNILFSRRKEIKKLLKVIGKLPKCFEYKSHGGSGN
jgi:hypothetical protein